MGSARDRWLGALCFLPAPKILSMWSKIKNFLFPFSEKNAELNHFWAHRLAVVLFFAVLLWIFSFLWFDLGELMSESYISCLSVQNTSEAMRMCEEAYRNAIREERWVNLGTAFAAAFFASYLLQLLYYKVVLWVILGKGR